MSYEQLTRFGVTISTSLVLTVALASCGEGKLSGDPASGGTSASAAGAGVGSGGAAASAAGGTAGTISSSGATSGGSSAGGAGSATGGTNSGTGGTTQTCTNTQHPDHQDKACSIWPEWDTQKGAGEPKDCDAEWLTGAGYCLESCGKCQPSVGTGGGGGTGGTDLGPGPDLPDLSSGQVYWASRYWDCCKPHCAWYGMPSCGSDGVSSNSGDSACGGGSAYACYNEAPRAVGNDVSYGYVAVPNPSCGTCYHLQFTGTGQHNPSDPGSKAIAGKHMIVKITNTGGDVGGNQFDLMIPGGGVGLNPGTCKAQWGVSDEGQLGPSAGGFLAACADAGSHAAKKECVRTKCSLIPAGDARDGCLWFVDWYEVADNPNFRYESIACPSDM